MSEQPTREGSSWQRVEEVAIVAAVVLAGVAVASIDWTGWWVHPPVSNEAVLETADPAPQAVETPPELGGLGVDVRPRASWRARPPRGRLRIHGPPTRITIHHQAALFDRYDLASTVRELRSIQKHHQSVRKWTDVGYHMIVDRAGRIWEGRPVESIGAHAGNRAANRGNLGILVLGDYDRQELSIGQRVSIRVLLERACAHWGIERSSVLTHNEIRKEQGLHGTLCPGRDLAELVEAFRLGR